MFLARSLLFCWSGVTFMVLILFLRSIISALLSKGKLPPGPRGLPLLGNVFQLPQFQWLRFTEWKDEFGPIFSLNLAGQPVVVLNTHKVAADLLDHRSTIYSDRPRYIMADEILSCGGFLPLIGYGESWRKLRRAAHEGMSVHGAQNYQPLQEKEAALLVSGLLHDPNAWEDHLRRSTASTMLSAVYGLPTIESKDDPIITRINDIVHRITHAALPGAYLVDIFPIMKHLPSWMVKWKREGIQWYQKDTMLFKGLIDGVRERMSRGNHQTSLAASFIENDTRHELTKTQSAWLAGTMFGAGTETTATVLANFMLAVCLYPRVVRKAQAELDAIVGRDRIPSFADRPHLPYIQALVKELLRWRPVAPLGGPRRAVQDDWYNGYYIPKGTIVLTNIWAMNRDPTIYPDYEEFRPERFLDTYGKAEVIPPDTHGHGHVSFGFGRRICTGIHIANQALFIDIASILWALNIENAVDINGSIIIPSRTECINQGLVVRPVPFPCQITARFADVNKIVEEAKTKPML